MDKIKKEQIKRIYILGRDLGILEPGNKEDNLHLLVCRVTGKSSISELTEREYHKVLAELLNLMKFSNRTAPLKKKPQAEKKPGVPGMMTGKQQALAWRCIYRLVELDTAISTATAGERMCGAIQKILGISVNLKNPFAWITFEQGQKLIEALKRYVKSAESKAKKAGATSG